jgi:hypothetical protein
MHNLFLGVLNLQLPSQVCHECRNCSPGKADHDQKRQIRSKADSLSMFSLWFISLWFFISERRPDAALLESLGVILMSVR